MKFAPIVPLAVAMAFFAAVACGPKLDPVQVEATDTTGGGDTTGGNATGGTGTGTTGVCGTSDATIAYAAHAQAVLTKSCGSSNCHGGSQRPVMTDYASSKTGISGGGLSEIQAGTMPLGSALSVNDKCILTTWASDGYSP